MLKGWNRKVRITRAISRAWMTTRMVSPKPLSDFVPEVTLIAFSIPSRSQRGGRALSLSESLFAPRQGNGPDSDSESEFRRKPEFALAEVAARGFRRLFAGTQSTVASKLSNPLKDQTFLVLRPAPRHAARISYGLAASTAEMMTKACAIGQSSVMLRSI